MGLREGARLAQLPGSGDPLLKEDRKEGLGRGPLPSGCEDQGDDSMHCGHVCVLMNCFL